MSTGLHLRTSQTLALTPQLQQSIRLLQLSTLELQQELEHMLCTNPFLERVEDEAGTTSADEAQHHSDDFDDASADAMPDTCALLADDAHDITALREHSDDWSTSLANESRQSTSSDDLDDHASDFDERSLTDIWDNGSTSSVAPDEDNEQHQERETPHISLQQHLHQQVIGLHLREHDNAALYCLIESLDDDGYLQDSLGEIAQSLLQQHANSSYDDSDSATSDDPDEAFFSLLHHLTVALRLLQSCEPTGVGARNLAECLQLQLKALRIPETHSEQRQTRATALAICQQPLEYLARRDVRSLQKFTDCSAASIKQAMQLIATLEPKPGRRFSDITRHHMLPDVLVSRNTGKNASKTPWLIELNPDTLPRVRVCELYAQAMRGHRESGHEALQQHLQEARYMVKSIQQRYDTIMRVAQAIVERQQRFFEQGVLAMQPLVLREIADALGMHESTISRVTTAKYMATPWGTFELKYFFSSGLDAEDGSAATSSTVVRAMLQQMIAAEDCARPLSDMALCQMLQEQGIQCARRTVAKYREALQIPPAHLRKSLQDI